MKVKRIIPAGKADVYNMEVDDTHSFIIQGGIVSHNCADEARYFLMSRPIKPPAPKADDPFLRSPLHLYLDIKPGELPVR